MKPIWDLKIRNSLKKEFAGDIALQELHELRLRSPFTEKEGIVSLSQDLKRDGIVLRKKGDYYIIE